MELSKTAAKTLFAAACGSAATFACQWAYGKYFNGPKESDEKFKSVQKMKATLEIVDKNKGSTIQSSSSQSSSSHCPPSQSSSSQSSSSQSSSSQASSSQSSSSQSPSFESSSSQRPLFQGSSSRSSSSQSPSFQSSPGKRSSSQDSPRKDSSCRCSSGQEAKGTGKDKSVRPKTNEKSRKNNGYKPLAREIGNSRASKVGMVSPLSANVEESSGTRTLKKGLKKDDSGIVDGSGSQALNSPVQSSNMNLSSSSDSLRLSEECVCGAATAEDIFQDSSLDNVQQDKEGNANKSQVGTTATIDVGTDATTPEFADKCIETEESGYCKGDEDIILIDRRLLHMIIQSVMQLETRLQQYEGGSGETVSFLQQLMQQ